MNKQDYEKLLAELNWGCRSFRPSAGPHNPHDIQQYFDGVQITETEQNAVRRAASLETLERQGFTADQLTKAIDRENHYYDQRQQTIDRTIGDAERETCRANGIVIHERTDRPEHSEVATASDRSDLSSVRRLVIRTSENRETRLRDDEQYGQRGTDSPNKAKFIGEIPNLPPERLLTRSAIAASKPQNHTPELKVNPPTLGDDPQSRQPSSMADKREKVFDGPTRPIAPGEQYKVPGRYAREHDPDGYGR